MFTKRQVELNIVTIFKQPETNIVMKRTTFRLIGYESWSRTGVTCVGSGFGGITWL